jgi:hypothetical protein
MSGSARIRWALAVLALASSAAAHPTSDTLYYTRFCGGVNVKSVDYTYDGTTFTLAAPVDVASLGGADGILFAPDGRLVVGGQSSTSYRLPTTGSPVECAQSSNDCPGCLGPVPIAVFHISLDPTRTFVRGTHPLGSSITEIPLAAFGACPGGAGTTRCVTGDDSCVTSIAYDQFGRAYYTVGEGIGNFGTIDLSTNPAVTSRDLTGLEAAHGMVFDPLTGHLFLFGEGHVTQVEPLTRSIVSDLDLTGFPCPGSCPTNPSACPHFDQGTTDGRGHVFVASNSGHLLFVDYSVTGLVGDPANFRAMQFLDCCLDDLAPLAGLGAPPELSCADVVRCNDSGRCDAAVTYEVVASPGTSVDCDPPPGATFPVGETDVTCTATDASGLQATCEFTVTVNDCDPPALDCPCDLAAPCSDVPPATPPGATDNCDASVGFTLAETQAPGACPDSFVITRTWTAVDDAGNTATCSHDVVVSDTIAPVPAGCPANATVECGDALPPPAAVTATDDCDASPAVTMTETSVPGCCPGTSDVTRTWTARDACGNTASCAQVVAVRDTTPPALAGCPPDATVGCGSPLPPAAVTATDGCDPAPVVTLSEVTEPGGCAGTGVVTRTWTARDACGNVSSCTQVVQILDTTPPVVAATTAVGCLWPPNHDFVDVGLAIAATDDCTSSGALTFAIGVLSDERTNDQNGSGGPIHCPDAIVEGMRVRLRAERAGLEDGRVYTLLVTATDLCGNSSTAAVEVRVPHDQSPKSPGQSPGNDPNGPCIAIDTGRAVDATACP